MCKVGLSEQAHVRCTPPVRKFLSSSFYESSQALNLSTTSVHGALDVGITKEDTSVEKICHSAWNDTIHTSMTHKIHKLHEIC